MNYPQSCSSDPQVTAFALGQLEGDERVAMEAAVRADLTLQAEVESIRAAAALIEEALAAEMACPEAPAPIPERGVERLVPPVAAGRFRYDEPRRGRSRSVGATLLRFPQLYYVAGGFAAACLAVIVAVQRVEYRTREEAEGTIARIALARQRAAEAAALTAPMVIYINRPEAAPSSTTDPRPVTVRPRLASAGPGPGLPVLWKENPFLRVTQVPQSVLPAEVDAGGYGLVRRLIRQGVRPPAEAIRIEEMLNYFPFRYPTPKGDALFAAALEVASAPWSPAHRLVRIGLQGREAEEKRGSLSGAAAPTLARDVRIRVDFNPASVARYRLIGYDARAGGADERPDEPARGDDVVPGHRVTALYEIVPPGADEDADGPGGAVSEGRAVGRPEPLRLATNTADGARGLAGRELLTVTVQYRLPDEAGGRWLEFPLTDTGAMFEAASADFRFAAAVAQFGMILQASEYRGAATLGDVLAWAAAALPDPADDLGGYRFDFLDLVRRAQGLAE